MNVRFAVPLLLCVSPLAIATPAAAQQSESSPGADDEAIVITAQQRNATEVLNAADVGVLGSKDALDVPFNVRTYTETLILNQQPLTLGEVLDNDPTIRTSYGFGNAAELFVVRGFPLFGDDLGFNGLYGITPRQLVAPELYQEVQVLNGASAFLNGAAPGGTGVGGNINLVPKRAGTADLTRVTANYISDSHFGGSADVARRFADDTIGVRVNGAYRAGDVSVDDEFRRTAVVGGAIDYAGERLRVALDIAYQRVEVDGLRPKVQLSSAVTEIPDVPDADANYAQPWTSTELRDVFGTLTVEYDLADNALLYAAIGARDTDEAGTYGNITLNDGATGAATGGGSFIPYEANNESARAGARIDLEGAGITHEFNVGGNVLWQEGRTAYDFFTGYETNLYDTPVVAQPGSNFAGGDLDNPFPINRTHIASLFASDTIGLWDDRILVTGGLRMQVINTKTYGYDGSGLTEEYDDSAITPVVGVVVKPSDRISFFANRIEGLAAGETAPVNDEDIVNPGEAFPPYKSVQYEVGGKARLGTFNAALALFQTEQPNGYARPVDPAEPDGDLVYGVFGEQRNRGIELTLNGELTEELRLIAGGSVLEAKLRDTGGVNEGNDAAGVPEYLLNANVEWDLPFLRGLTLTGRAVHTGEQAANAANTLRLDSWTTFDIGARYVAAVGDRPLTLRAGIDNVANERYWATAFDSFGTALLQGTPRTFRLSASIDL
ncbi:TonB-dependent receptor [Pacificimonas flava]|uniref:Ferrichrome-iron receptor n=1 Tax=Pacificimonas flava TaxID=1234595 RepID=M2SFQ2_9SPHN|nr:TonB-dependent siderophore receptor [Pacificimonas flava]EMD84200.1 Ferrichrome-iron receptor [Pacificimonas flava]MBB5279923.1 iron complex outermembrane receptor protein [Pacificimonas flava]